MRLIRLEVKNFCQHRELTVEFHPRLTAILGQNGSGKSNLLAAALGALTNDFSRTNGTKAENICQSAPEGERSYVTLTFEHNGTEVEVRRGIYKSTSYWMEGDDTVRGDRAVTERIQQFLGTSTKIINEYVFVEQGEIFAPLMARAADRGKAYQQLFGTAHAEVCWKAVGDHLADMTIPEAGVVLDGLRAASRQAALTVHELKSQLAGISIDADYDPNEDPAFKLLQKYDKLVSERARHDAISAEILVLQEELVPLVAKKSELDVDVSSLEEALAGHVDKYEAAARAVHNWNLLDEQRKAIVARENIVAELEEEFKDNPEPVKPDPFVDADAIVDYQKETTFLEAKRRGKEDMIDALDPAKGVVECPTCSTPVADLEMDIEYAKSDIVKLNNEVDAREQIGKAVAVYHAAFNRWEVWKSGWESRQEDLLEQSLPGVDSDALLTEDELSDIRDTKDRYEKWQVALVGANSELRTTGQSVAVKEGALDSKVQARDSMEVRIHAWEDAGVTTEAVTEAKMCLPARREAYDRRLHTEGQLSAAVSTAALRLSELAASENALEESQRLVSFADHLREVRETLHRDNLPRVVAHNYLGLLHEAINEILEAFATDFRVAVREDLGFDAHFIDGRIQPVPRLSGGQKVVLALAFRISINALFAADLGLLCLDEPTAYLDDENLACLDVALDKLRSLSESRGLQCILITHERGLGHMFDEVVQL